MAEFKSASVATTEPFGSLSNHDKTTLSQTAKNVDISLARRGILADGDAIDLTEEETAQGDRTLLSAQEERALLRRIDWRIMTVCSMLFLLKNIDADNISNARIMNRGTDRNIITELNMTSDQYNLLNVLYYVC